MAYQRQEFIDHVEDANGNVLVEGTTLTKSIMEHIEDGIVANEEAIKNAKTLPTVTTSDNGKLLQVVDGAWSAVTITDGNEVAY